MGLIEKLLWPMAYIGAAYMTTLPKAKRAKTKEETDKLIDEAIEDIKAGHEAILNYMKEQIH